MHHFDDHYTRSTRQVLAPMGSIREISGGRLVDARTERGIRNLNDHLLRDIGYFRHRWRR